MLGYLVADSAPTDLEIWWTSDGDGDQIVVQDAQLNALWMGEIE
jgi:hypothetical protein